MKLVTKYTIHVDPKGREFINAHVFDTRGTFITLGTAYVNSSVLMAKVQAQMDAFARVLDRAVPFDSIIAPGVLQKLLAEAREAPTEDFREANYEE